MRNQIKLVFTLLTLAAAPSLAQAEELFVARQGRYVHQQSYVSQKNGKWACASELHDHFPVKDPSALWPQASALTEGDDSAACEDEVVIRFDGAAGTSHVRRACADEASVKDFLNQLAHACGRS